VLLGEVLAVHPVEELRRAGRLGPLFRLSRRCSAPGTLRGVGGRAGRRIGSLRCKWYRRLATPPPPAWDDGRKGGA